MENIKISELCGICAGCKTAITKTEKLLKENKNVTLFKKIVHNKNVNSHLQELGATTHETLNEIIEWKNNNHSNAIVILRAHGEPPETYEILNDNNINFVDCTCVNVKKIHENVADFSERGYKVILVGKYGKKSGEIHPEVFGTLGWCKGGAILIEDEEDLNKLEVDDSSKYYLICQTTFNIDKMEKISKKAQDICNTLSKELVINKSICHAQKLINQKSAELAKDMDLMIVIGGKNSSNTAELAKSLSSICKTIYFEDINSWKEEFKIANITLSPNIKIGLTAGASTMKEELEELKVMLEDAISKL